MSEQTRYGLYKAYRDAGKDHEIIVEVMQLNRAEESNFIQAYQADAEYNERQVERDDE